MDSLALGLILISAGSHAIWNYLAKGSSDKESFMLLMNFTSQFTILPVFVFLLRDWVLPLDILPFIVLSAIAEVVYFLSLSRAYDAGDLSVVYPVARSAPLFVAVASAALLGESITILGFVGILLILTGIYVLHLRGLSWRRLLEPLRPFKSPASGFALIAALGTTVYSISDKVGVTRVHPLLYSFWLEIVITIALTPIVVRGQGLRGIASEWGRAKARITISGALMRGGYILVLVAMTLAPVSYLLALRQVSVVVGSLLGLVLLGEKYGATRLLGSATIFAGVYVLATLT